MYLISFKVLRVLTQKNLDFFTSRTNLSYKNYEARLYVVLSSHNLPKK
jgi:hypothetical protein